MIDKWRRNLHRSLINLLDRQFDFQRLDHSGYLLSEDRCIKLLLIGDPLSLDFDQISIYSDAGLEPLKHDYGNYNTCKNVIIEIAQISLIKERILM